MTIKNEIRMCDLQTQYLQLKPEIDSAIQNVLSSSHYIKGEVVGRFEQALADYLGVPFCISVANGTDALTIAMMALGLEEGDEVICPSFTFVATAEAAALLRLRPIPVDVCPDTMTLDIEAVKRAITDKTKAIIPVHLFGLCADMEPLMQIAQEHNLYLVEDTAQAIGAEWIAPDGSRKKAGTIGDIGCTSFFPSKNLGCYGDGGALFTHDAELAQRIRSLANHGSKVRYYHERIGMNSRLDSIQAAVLLTKLPYLDKFNSERQQAAAEYNAILHSCGLVTTPTTPSYSTHVYHQYTLRLDASIDRDKIQQLLKAEGIPTMVYYPVPIHQQFAYQAFANQPCPMAEQLAKSVLSLPMHTCLTTEQIQFITWHLSRLIQN